MNLKPPRGYSVRPCFKKKNKINWEGEKKKKSVIIRLSSLYLRVKLPKLEIFCNKTLGKNSLPH